MGLTEPFRRLHVERHHASVCCFGSRNLEKPWLCILFRGSQTPHPRNGVVETKSIHSFTHSFSVH